jgi:hypothetical protein
MCWIVSIWAEGIQGIRSAHSVRRRLGRSHLFYRITQVAGRREAKIDVGNSLFV